MINLIIPGFGTTIHIFNDFLKLCPEADFISLNDYTYNEVELKLKKIANKNGKLNLFGWSLGAMFALKWAIDNQDKVASLFLTGATARFTEKDGYDNGILQKKLDQMRVLIKRRSELVMHDFYETCLGDFENKEKYLKILKKNTPSLDALINGLNELNDIDLLDKLSQLSIPVSILHGTDDQITPVEGAKILDSLLLNSVLTTCQGGHSLFLEAPELCIKKWKELLCTTKG